MLKLSTKGRYGLRAMIDLAEYYNEGPVLMSAIAERQDVSRKYLHALLTSLKEAGFVKSRRGAKGGYLLAKKPSSIRVSDVFEALEGTLVIIDCLDEADTCSRSSHCVARDMWKDVNTAMVDVLKGVTLADLAKKSKK